MPSATAQAADQAQEIRYPSSDGEPMAETPVHVQAIILLLQALQDVFRSAADVFVAADMFWYWEKGNPAARRAPDVMVFKGVDNRERRSFFSWLENGAVPAAVFEIASENTWREDLYEKHRLYAQLRVPEYFMFDPEALYLRPALLGFRRNEHGAYTPLEPDEQERLKSEELGLYLKAEGAMLRLIDAATGQPVLTKDERLAQQEERIAQLQALLEQVTGKKAP
jgi:Uma2 family endonuclease